MTVFICSDNQQLIEICRRSLSPDFVVSAAPSLDQDSASDSKVIIIDNQVYATLFLAANYKAEIPVLLIASELSEQDQLNAIFNGISGYLDMNAAGQLLIKAVNQVIKGDIWINRHLVPKLIRSVIDKTEEQDNVSRFANQNILLDTLSDREIEVAKMIGSGENNKRIANALHISERTVKAHLTSIFRKLDVPDRLHLAILIKESV